jgi:photosystem II stability/assembly factor-like uncharacterized protein
MKKKALLLLVPLLIISMFAFGQVRTDSIAKIDDHYSLYAGCDQSIAYCRANKSLQMVMLTDVPTAGFKLFYLSSTNEGVTWSSVGPLNKTNQTTYYQAIAVSDAGVPYIVYRTNPTSTTRGIYFTTADDFASAQAGLFSTPVIINDTSKYRVNMPSISVSKDGKTVMVAWTTYNPPAYSGTETEGHVTVSTDAGKTWATPVLVFPRTQLMTLFNAPTQHLEEPSIVVGKNGFALAIGHALADTLTLWGKVSLDPVYSVTTDNGKTWSAPKYVGKPVHSSGEKWGFDTYWVNSPRPIVDDNNNVHFTTKCYIPPEGYRMFDFKFNGTSWTTSPVTPNYNVAWNLAPDGNNICIDPSGKLYAIYKMDPTGSNDYQIWGSASTDGGTTWLSPFKISKNAASIVVHSVEGPMLVDNRVYCIYPNTWWDKVPTAMMMTSCPVDSLLKQPAMSGGKVIDPGGYTAATATYSWNDISATGTPITNWVNGKADPDGAKDDGYSATAVPLGFDFNFYGTNYNQLYVGVNGLVSFTHQVLNSSAQYGASGKDSLGYFDGGAVVPGTTWWPNCIAVAYADLDLNATDTYGNGRVIYKTTGGKFVLTYEGIGTFEATLDTMTFQLVLDPADNSITIQYKQFGTPNTRNTMKVGIQKNDATGLGWVAAGFPPAKIPTAGSAVKFSPAVVPQWAVQTNPSPSLIYSIKAVDQNVVWASADTGTVLRTTNGGTTWEKKTVDTKYGKMNAIDAVDANTAWVSAVINSSGGDCKVFKTTDGGATWTSVLASTAEASYFDGLKFWDANNGLLVADPEDGYYNIETTTNAGASWTRTPQANIPPVISSSEYILTNSMSVLGNNAWCGTGGGSGLTRVLRSTNRGQNWTAGPVITTTLGSYLYGTALMNNSVGWVVGTNGKVAMTTDGGATWGSAITTGATRGRVAQYLGGQTVVFVGDAGKIFISKDLGATWSSQTLPVNVLYNALSFVSGTVGWIAGANGAILKYIGGTLVSVDEKQNGSIPETYALWQNYPNPFNPTTTVAYDLPKAAKITLKVYNILGQVVAVLAEGQQAAGRYVVPFNASTLASGVYFYRLQAGDFVQTNKMVLVR